MSLRSRPRSDLSDNLQWLLVLTLVFGLVSTGLDCITACTVMKSKSSKRTLHTAGRSALAVICLDTMRSKSPNVTRVQPWDGYTPLKLQYLCLLSLLPSTGP